MGTYEDILARCTSKGDTAALAALVSFVTERSLSVKEIAQMVASLANSGERLTVPTHRTADIASTGGPTSLSTLLCPLYLRRLGFCVPALGMPGRPAGAVDVLAQIPGYQVHLSPAEARKVLNQCGYLHVVADSHFAPLDARLFAFRGRTNTVALPVLVVSSLLAKKLAMGVRTVGLDIRVGPHGNFGCSFPEAKANAALFCQVAAAIGIRATCFLTDASVPFQPHVGRAESLLALVDLLEGRASEWLKEHADMCERMALALLDGHSVLAETGLQTVFAQNLEAQGSSYARCLEYVEQIKTAPRVSIVAERSGFVAIDLGVLRSAIAAGQSDALRSSCCEFPDGCGVVLTRRTDERVERGDAIGLVRCSAKSGIKLVDSIKRAFHIRDAPYFSAPMDMVHSEVQFLTG